MRVALPVVLLLAGPLAASAGPREVVDDCALHPPAKATGLTALEDGCPGLGAALDELGVGPLLSDETKQRLSAGSLRAAVSLASEARPTSATALRTATLPTALGSLAPPAVGASWWERFKEWVRAQLKARRSDAGNDRGWLASLFSGISRHQSLLEVVLDILKFVIVVLAIGIVVNELRAYGVFGARAARGRGRPGAPPAAATRRTVTMADVEAAPAGRRAALLFEVLVAALAANGRIPATRSRTHRELSRAAVFAEPADTARFTRLAETAEEQLFAAAPVPDERLGAALADGAALYASVAAPAGAGA